ncbi:hypothetical protein DSCO28_04130 [Desulfosarcina ovata subsp. sediminis]|uniref:Glycosyltransferase 2-like domain-containing protein n=1 Tax=Desulfosarcina ovata subsp. sediminis TaxID=885957 RepID=A0A5K7ZIR0_9BACT|nr:glycosyltransferase [Desulfosarcina ovata]BBO79847.1 hypothetical protein DSCO28_04130 [Desulfosarcina ovata subsp. sediminis]
MYDPIKVVDEELSDPPRTIENLDRYIAVKILTRLHGIPIGWVRLPVIDNRVEAVVIRKTILEKFKWKITKHSLQSALSNTSVSNIDSVEALFSYATSPSIKKTPLISVAVCSRDRAEDLEKCLGSLIRLEYSNLELLVVDNAPSNESTARLVKESFPGVRYIMEDRPGLDWARNRAVLEAKGEIIAYTDDDVIVDGKWAQALADLFVSSPEVMAVTGLVVPHELETEAQHLFEAYGGFDRGVERKWAHTTYHKGRKSAPYGTGQFGTGANMAFRRCLFDKIGLFDTALDVGTVTNGGGDLEMFFRVIKEGYTLVYEPRAIVRHRHRRKYEQLKTQLINNGIGLFSYLIRSAIHYPEDRFPIIRFGLWWFNYWNIRRLLLSFLVPSRFPRELIWAELKGSLIGIGRYFKARRIASEIASSYPLVVEDTITPAPSVSERVNKPTGRAVRAIDLDEPLSPITDIGDYESVNIFVSVNNRLLGSLIMYNHGNPISIPFLRQVISENFILKVLADDNTSGEDNLWAQAQVELERRYMPDGTASATFPSNHLSADVVVATYDRPDDLRHCLQSLIDQKTDRDINIIVVDNHPASGLTPPVVAQFSNVRLVPEHRQGVSYARNAGILETHADIIICTDDDVMIPSNWVEMLVKPFAQKDVMAVTSNVLPFELKTESQVKFEAYGGLGRGYKDLEFNADWFESFKKKAVPTWLIGGTAGAAFRANVFHHPQIGLFEETLGPGMPSGVGEDTLMFYKILKAGYTINYQSGAYVWHKHRKSDKALRNQIFNYSKGHVAYHLMTILSYKDYRAVFTLFYHLPLWHLKQLKRYVVQRISHHQWKYPLRLILLEITGNIAGPWNLWKSFRRVKHEGRSRC